MCVESVACVVSSVAGRYGIGLPITFNGCEVGAAAIDDPSQDITGDAASRYPRNRNREPSGCVAGRMVGRNSGPARVVGLPGARQPDVAKVAPVADDGDRRRPPLGTSCHMKPLACDMSTGLVSVNVASYRTLPSASAPSWISVMIVACGSWDRVSEQHARAPARRQWLDRSVALLNRRPA